MEKKNYFILLLIILITIGFRIWNLPLADTVLADFQFSLKNDFFDFFFTNNLTPVYFYFTKLFTLPYLDKIAPYSLIICDIISVITRFFVGKEFNDKKNENLVGLVASGFSAISIFLITLSQNKSLYSLTFMFSSFVILFSLKVINTQNKKYLIPIGIFSLLMFFTFNLSAFFVIFNLLAILGLYAKKRKTFTAFFLTFIAILLLLCPIVPFILNVLNIPDYLVQYSLPFNYEHIVLYLVNMFAPNIKTISALQFQNIGCFIFIILPTIIGIIMTTYGLLGKKRTNFYAILLFTSAFLSMLIMCLCAKQTLQNEYLVTIYPILIMCFANGVPAIKNNSFKVILPTIFATITVFYIIANNLIAFKLF